MSGSCRFTKDEIPSWIAWENCSPPLSQILTLFLFLLSVTSTSGTCAICCPPVFNNPDEGIVSIRERSPLLHTVSYITRCILSSEDVMLISDDIPALAESINMQRYKGDRRWCTYPENLPMSFMTAESFLSTKLGFFKRFNLEVPSSTVNNVIHPPTSKRANFIFTTSSEVQMQMLIEKVDDELRLLRSGSKLVWQPIIIFLWSEIQQIFLINEKNISTPSQKVLKSWFNKYQPNFAVDSGIFFFFMVQRGSSIRSQSTLFLTIHEAYSLKTKFTVRQLTEGKSSWNKKTTYYDDQKAKCNDAKERSSATEKVNSYIFLERFRRRSNFERLPLVASVMNASGYSDWFTMTRDSNGVLTLEKGFSVSIYRDFQRMMNFSESLIVTEKGSSKSKSNSSQVAPSRPLDLELADISLNQEAVYPERAEAFSFLQPTYSGIYQAFFQQPSANSIRDIVSAPFKLSLWVTLISTWLLLISCVYSWGWVAKRNGVKSYYMDVDFINEIGLWTIAATCQKSWYISPTTLIFKTIFYIGSLMAVVCYVAYSATIVSFLTVKTVPVKSFLDLIEYEYKFTVHEYSQATKLLLLELIDEFSLPQKVITTNTEKEITHIIDSKKAFLSYPDLFYQIAAEQNFTENFLCVNIHNLPAQNVPYKTSMFVKKGSQYQELFSEKLLILLERGLNYRYRHAYDSKREISCVKPQYDDGQTVVDPVHLTDVFTAFLVIFIGWIIASWVLFSERLYHRRKVFYLIF